MNLANELRAAMKRDGRSVYRFAKDTGMAVSIVQAFVHGGGLRLDSASKLCDVLGLRLVRVEGMGR